MDGGQARVHHAALAATLPVQAPPLQEFVMILDTPARVEEQARLILQAQDDGDGAHDLAHVGRVVRMAARIDRELGHPCDPLVLCAAAWLHDLVSLPKSDPDRARASARSADEAVAKLRRHGFPEERLAAVHHAILAHSFSAGVPCQTIEAKVLQDADRMDALGAIGLARCFYTAGRMDAQLFDPADPLGQHRELDDRAFALDHLPVKLYRIAETLHTAPARAIAAERVAFLKAFAARIVAEAG